MNRRKARRMAFELVYEYSYHSNEPADLFYEFELENREAEDDPYVRRLFFGIKDVMTELDEEIKANAVGWGFERLSPVSLAIMRLAVYEMLYEEDVPYSVSINEAVELAKSFDHEKAPKFINGVLNAVAERKGLKSQK